MSSVWRRFALAAMAVIATSLVTAPVLILGPTAAYAHDERETRAPDGTGQVPTYRTEGPTLLVCKTDKVDFDQRIATFAGRPQGKQPRAVDAVPERRLPPPAGGGQQRRSDRHDHQDSAGRLLRGAQPRRAERRLRQPARAPGRARLPGAVVGAAGGLPQQPEPRRDPGQAGSADRGHRRQARGRRRRRPVPATQRDPGRPGVRHLPTQLHRAADDLQRGLHHGVRRVRHRPHGRALERRVRIPHLRRRPRPLHRLRGVRQRRLGNLPGRVVGHQRQGPPRRRPVRDRDPNCHSHDNLLGYSGTAGNSVWAHDNVFTENTVGVATDSAFPNHPGLPQNHALFERNVIGDNNLDYYRHVRDGTCRSRSRSAATNRASSARQSAYRSAPG